MAHTTLVVLSVVEDNGKYLLVQEHDGSWYLPAGRVEAGENLIAAAVRETVEEAGILIGLRGIIGFDHEWSPRGMRMRFCFVGYPATNLAPKSTPDEHTLSARWFTRAQIEALTLRHPEVLTWIRRSENAPVLPCAAYEPYGMDVPSVPVRSVG